MITSQTFKMGKSGNKRERNNVSVKNCREKKKKEEEEKKLKKEKLREENSALETSIKALNHELDFMLQVVKTHSDAGGGQAMKNQHFEELFLLCHEKL